MSEETRDQASEGKRELARKLDAGGWGLFFIWIGIAVYTSVGWGATLFGIGVITLASQLVRKYSGLPFERFWLVVGALFVFGGLWKALAIGLGRPAIAGRSCRSFVSPRARSSSCRHCPPAGRNVPVTSRPSGLHDHQSSPRRGRHRLTRDRLGSEAPWKTQRAH
jgi:hypothetical protein